jgi:transcriptional regulator with XRE-family HTH domain
MTPDLDRLADAVKNRRIQLNLSIRRAAEAAGVSKDTWMRVESGGGVRHMTYDKIEAVLGWTVGGCRKIMDGQEPVLLDLDVDADARFTAVPPEMLEAEVGTAVQGALIATTDDLTAAQIRQINERVIELLRARGILPPAE